MKLQKLASLALAGALTLGLLPALASPALAEGDTSTYTITIPATPQVSGSGYTELTDTNGKGITASGTIGSGKKLSISAASTNEWKLKDGSKEVPYKLTNNNEGDPTEKMKWEFEADTNGAITGNEKIYAYIAEDDYTNAAAGTYQDTVTFTAKVENAVTTKTVTWNNDDITGTYGQFFTKDGVTITANGSIDFMDKNFMGGGTFTTTLGKFTKIEVTEKGYSFSGGTGWSGKTWTGNASSVSFSGDIMGMEQGVTFVFTIEE